MMMPMKSVETMESLKLREPTHKPSVMAKKRKMVSLESLIAVRKRTMDRAPTIPREMTILEEIISMMTREIRRVRIRLKQKRWL